MVSPLVRRAARPSPLASAAPRASLLAPLPVRQSSWSAIHRGLREEQGKPPKVPDFTYGDMPVSYRERRLLREALKRERSTFRIRKGKKDITEYPDEAKPKSRRARFYDPDDPFGKKSLVYQLKAGPLGEQLRAEMQKAREEKEREKEQEKGQETGQQTKQQETGQESKQETEQGTEQESSRQQPARVTPGLSEIRTSVPRPDLSLRGVNIAPRANADMFEVPEPDKDDGPMPWRSVPLRIPFTTASSQFLYGKNIVEAALRSGRRRLYKLYIHDYRPLWRQPEIKYLEALAKNHGVEIWWMQRPRQLRLMEKMSHGRPHNGFILEASPLPQPPLLALGPLVDGTDERDPRVGFRVELGHQSTEELAVNGAPDMVVTERGTYRPLVLVLDRILDPENLGSILRSASFLGATAVVMTAKASTPVTPTAVKASCGGCEDLPLFTVKDVASFLAKSRANGWAIYATVAEAPFASLPASHLPTPLRIHYSDPEWMEATFPKPVNRPRLDLADLEAADPLREKPCVLVMGNEGEGLDRRTMKEADYLVNIPRPDAGFRIANSLNVGVAAALVCSSMLRGRTKEKMAQQDAAREADTLF